MTTPTVERKSLDFIMAALAHSDAIKTDWHALAAEFGYTKSNNTQQKFKKLIESTGRYALVNGKVIDTSDPDAAVPSTPSTKRGRGGKATGTPKSTSKKRNLAVKGEDADASDDYELLEMPAKKKAPAKRPAAKKAAARVKEEAAESGDEVKAANDSDDKEVSAEETGNADDGDSGGGVDDEDED